MRIQNPALAGKTLGLRYSRDENGNPKQAQGDAKGIFDMPEKDADFLLNTSGWNRIKKAKALEPSPAPQVTESNPEIPPPGNEGGSEETNEDPPELQLETIHELRTKAAALSLAEKYGVELDEDAKLKDMKAELELALFEDASDEESEDENAEDSEEE